MQGRDFLAFLAAPLVAEREARDCTGARGPPFHGFLWPVL